MKDVATILGVVFLFVAVPLALLFAIVVPLEYGACSSKASKMGFEFSWGPLQDCMINADGQWILLDSYKTAKIKQ